MVKRPGPFRAHTNRRALRRAITNFRESFVGLPPDSYTLSGIPSGEHIKWAASPIGWLQSGRRRNLRPWIFEEQSNLGRLIGRLSEVTYTVGVVHNI